jgi:3-oxoacyl-[acyl-carrier protein] reductase
MVFGSWDLIGRTVANRYAHAGAKVACLHPGEYGLETVEAIQRAGGQAQHWQCSLGSEASIRAAVTDVINKHGVPHIVFVDTGITGLLLLEESSIEGFASGAWDTVFHHVLMSQVALCRRLIPAMVHNNGGSISVLTAVNPQIGSKDIENAAFLSSQRAMLGLARHVHNRYSGSGIAINAIYSGDITPGETTHAAQSRADIVAGIAARLAVPSVLLQGVHLPCSLGLPIASKPL